MSEPGEPVLEIKQLKTYFYMQRGVVKAVDGVNININEGDKVGIVGESGSGKTATMLSVLRLIPNPPGRIVSGEILLKGKNLLKMSDDEIRAVRSSEVALIAQDPMVSLNPVLTIGDQIGEGIKQRFEKLSKSEINERVIEVLESVGITDVLDKLTRYPHQFSGGMRQRVLIAMAISRQPKILMADEPTTNLDVTTQAQVLKLINDLMKKKKSSLVLVSHDMGVVAETCDKIVVMYAGMVMECGNIRDVFRESLHPYTRALLNSIPQIDVDMIKLEVIPGKVPDLINPPPGCRFHPRCKYARENCAKEVPALKEIRKEHFVACPEGE